MNEKEHLRHILAVEGIKEKQTAQTTNEKVVHGQSIREKCC
jgi:hypothetical protein